MVSGLIIAQQIEEEKVETATDFISFFFSKITVYIDTAVILKDVCSFEGKQW